jgi:hypothetical protein
MRTIIPSDYVLIAIIILPSARAIFKYLPSYPLIIIGLYAIAIVFIANIIKRRAESIRKERYIRHLIYIILLFIIAAGVVWLTYPIADGLKLQMRGSDQDDCVISGARHILRLSHPYIQTSYYGNPCSPGLGMLIIYMPFVFIDAYPLGALFYSAFGVLVLYRASPSISSVVVFTSLFFTSIFNIEMLVVGSDLFIVGFGLLIVGFQAIRAVSVRGMASIIMLAIYTGLIASTRVNFIVIAPILSVFIFMHWKKGAIVFSIISLSVAVFPSAYLYMLSPEEFTPFHLIRKSDNLLGSGLKEFAVMLSILAFIYGINCVKSAIVFIPSALLICLAPSLLAVSIGDLMLRGWKFSQWEGANYLLPLLPLSMAILSSEPTERSSVSSRNM